MINDTKLFGLFAAALTKTATYMAALSLSLVLGLIPFAVIAVDDYFALEARPAPPSLPDPTSEVARNLGDGHALLPCNNY